MEKEIEKIVTELFELIGLKVNFEVSKEGEDYKVEIDPGESSGLLIGGHGATLTAIQSFLGIAINRKKESDKDWVRVLVDIGGWGQKQSERLTELAQQTAERAKQTGEAQKLYNLNASQRRLVHMALAENGEIETLSEGEGQDRYLVIKLKK